jgi:transcriptional regulator with XRE-family HTH domain
MPGGNPTMRRRRLGMELRRLREATGLTIGQAAERLLVSESKISRMETGKVAASLRDVRDLLEVYIASDEDRDKLMEFAKEARQKGWWAFEFADVNAPFLPFESAATSMSIYAALVVPGLLQTQSYAQAVLRAIRFDLHPEEIDRLVKLRMERQVLLTGDDPPRLWVVIDEGAIRRVVGGPDTMRTQLMRVASDAALPHVTVQVLPFSAGAHAGLDGPFMVFGFPDPGDPELVHFEHTAKDMLLDDEESHRRYDTLFDRLRAEALGPQDSAQFIVTVANELEVREKGG